MRRLLATMVRPRRDKVAATFAALLTTRHASRTSASVPMGVSGTLADARGRVFAAVVNKPPVERPGAGGSGDCLVGTLTLAYGRAPTGYVTRPLRRPHGLSGHNASKAWGMTSARPMNCSTLPQPHDYLGRRVDTPRARGVWSGFSNSGYRSLTSMTFGEVHEYV